MLSLSPSAIIDLDRAALEEAESGSASHSGFVDPFGGGRNRTLHIAPGESADVMLSPFTPLHLVRRRLAYHGWFGGWGSITHPAMVRGRIREVTTCFGPHRFLCPRLSGDEVGQHADCAVCRLLEDWHMVVGDYREVFGSKLGVTFRYMIEALPLDGQQLGLRFLSLKKREAWPAFGRCTDEDFTRAWTVKRTENGLQLQQSTRRCRRRIRWGLVLSARQPDQYELAEFVEMVRASEGKMPAFDLGFGRALRLRERLGEDVTFVPNIWGLKRPPVRGWQDNARKWMADWPNYSAILDDYNIAFLCGQESGNLCSFDFDDPVELEPFFRLNSWARGAMRVIGRRGCSLLFRLDGKYPASVIKVQSTRNGKTHPIGELRLGNCLQTLDGLHKSGCLYRLEGTSIPTVSFVRLTCTFPPHWDALKQPEPRRVYHGERRPCWIDRTKLRFVRAKGPNFLDAQCPSCAAHGRDTGRNNLRVWTTNWGVHCIAGCTREEVMTLIGLEGWDGATKERDADYDDDADEERIEWKRSGKTGT